MLIFALACFAADKKKNSSEEYSLIAGTVFRDPGFALGGAQLVLEPVKAPKKFKTMKLLSDRRGEFAFRVPAEDAVYKLGVKAEGLAAEQKEITVAAGQRVDVYFSLKPQANESHPNK